MLRLEVTNYAAMAHGVLYKRVGHGQKVIKGKGSGQRLFC